MRVIFLPTGGFNKNGAFIEVPEGQDPTGNEPEYQRQGFLSLSLACTDFRVTRSLTASDERKKTEIADELRKPTRAISATGTIKKSRYSRFSLSLMGHKTEHSSLRVSIREFEGPQRVDVAGIAGMSDIDIDIDEEFYIQITMPPLEVDALISDIEKPGASMVMHVKLGKIGGFYSTWSPAIDAGRIIKFLGSRSDVENASEIPKDFWDEDLIEKYISDGGDPQVEIYVGRPLSAPAISDPDQDRDHPDQEDDDYSEPVAAPVKPARSSDAAITAAAKQIKRSITMLSVAVIVAAALVALG